LIDLHLHTTASDGRLTPEELVARAATAGITVMSVTDHDTVAGLADARRAADAAGIVMVDGVEVTSVHEGRDVHMLGYFIKPADQAFNAFLAEQRGRRVARVREIGSRLALLGAPVDIDRLLARAAQRPGASVGRAAIARALVRAGRVSSVREAFDRFLGFGCPAFVPRMGSTPIEVVEIIHRAGGVASMAHPGVTNKPDVMTVLVRGGLDAIEVFHSDHSLELQRSLQAFAIEHHLLTTGGSDFHGDDSRDRPLGRSTLPATAFERLHVHHHRRAKESS
jgi:predicted metal-dependent phosphoesterase TrpH